MPLYTEDEYRANERRLLRHLNAVHENSRERERLRNDILDGVLKSGSCIGAIAQHSDPYGDTEVPCHHMAVMDGLCINHLVDRLQRRDA